MESRRASAASTPKTDAQPQAKPDGFLTSGIAFLADSAHYLVTIGETATEEVRLSIMALSRLVAVLLLIAMMVLLVSLVLQLTIAYCMAVVLQMGWLIALLLLLLIDVCIGAALYHQIKRYRACIGFSQTVALCKSSTKNRPDRHA